MRVFTVNTNKGFEGNYYTGMCPTLIPFLKTKKNFPSACVFVSAASLTPVQRQNQQQQGESQENQFNLQNCDFERGSGTLITGSPTMSPPWWYFFLTGRDLSADCVFRTTGAF